MFRPRPDQIGIAAVGIELTQDRQIDITGVQGRVGFRACVNRAPLGRQATQARGVLEGLALPVGQLLRLLTQLAKERVEQCRVVITEMPGASGTGSG